MRMAKGFRGVAIGVIGVLLAREAVAGTVGRVDLETLRTPIYSVDGDAFVRHNGDRFNNRPLYCNQIRAIVLGGDRPMIRFGTGSVCNGTLMVALARGESAKWLQNCSDVTSKYRPGRMEWIVKDATWGETTVTLEAVTPAAGAGMAARLRVEGARAGDKLIWACGGAMAMSRENMLGAWDVTTAGREATMKRGFSADECRGDRVAIDGDHFIIKTPEGKRSGVAAGMCSAVGKMTVADAALWREPLKMIASAGSESPLVCGVIELDSAQKLFWGVRGTDGKDEVNIARPAEVFAVGMARAVATENRVVVDTPDAWLNTAVGASGAVTDAVFREGMYTHSGMRWGVPLLGWRSIFGATAYGWHDRVMTEAKYCIARQVKESDKAEAQADEKMGLSSQSPKSRLFGKGRVDAHQPYHYDMQSQFFDQLIHEWRATGDAELEKLLRPALELHLEYIHDCFDPDDDGIYESYANTWPTDDQWYNGGGTSEETAYAYTGHRAALEMARRAADAAAVKFHEARIERIHRAFMEKLWAVKSGHPGAYREQGGLKRLHEDCWLYSIFCPIDAGMLSNLQAAQALHYTEWGLERIRLPYGGVQVWPSNWVPSIWSVREMWPGDNYHLALAYFQTGLTDQGWEILHGTFPQMMFFGPVPGDLGHPAGATDFNDCASMFARTVVEGLFGYRPDYPNGVVTIAPQFPAGWGHASIKTPDVGMRFTSRDGVARYEIDLTRAAKIDMRIPICAERIVSVAINGREAKYDLQPGFGESIVGVNVESCQKAVIEFRFEKALPRIASEDVAATTGEVLPASTIKDSRVAAFEDPQGVLSDAMISDGAITGKVAIEAGDHMVLARVAAGAGEQWRMLKIKVADPKGTARREAEEVREIPANATWACVDLSKQLNGDIRTIFQQKYLSPRPNTCSLRLASDGYSTWQMVLDVKNRPPEIDLSGAAGLLRAGQIGKPGGAPFSWLVGSRNIAFTSQWDNWPRSVKVPVGSKGDAVWFLVCGSTNPMQGRIANAELRINYADGVVERIELTPPLNFWSLCGLGNADYNYARDGFALPKQPPAMLELGKNCRAVIVSRRLRAGVAVESVTLETLSQEVVIGLMGVTVMNPVTDGAK